MGVIEAFLLLPGCLASAERKESGHGEKGDEKVSADHDSPPFVFFFLLVSHSSPLHQSCHARSFAAHVASVTTVESNDSVIRRALR
jgi:hypothetical protein